MNYQFVYLNVVCLNDLESLCSNGRAGQGKPSRRYVVVPIFKSLHI